LSCCPAWGACNHLDLRSLADHKQLTELLEQSSKKEHPSSTVKVVKVQEAWGTLLTPLPATLQMER
jgi:hypothetical protein